MGGAVSSGRNNDDLIDNLLEADYIKTSLIERVFRAVDRGEYFLPNARVDAYKDLAWKNGNLHISAPCIYSEVMEGLELEPGLSFLNLGSGTGYLSTMVGLILGSRGVNHGVELHEDVIEYAFKKLDDFKKFSGAVDEFDFCEPKFVQGNCLCLSSENHGLYDRIYCGAACPEKHLECIKLLLKINGIFVVPVNDHLFQIRRLSESNWQITTLLPVSFASLIGPPKGFEDVVKPIEVEPLSLQALCRVVVRNILRKNVEKEHPPVKSTSKAPKKKRALKRLVVPLFNDDSSDDERHVVGLGGPRNREAGRAMFRPDREDDGLFGLFRIGMNHRRGSGSGRDRPSSHRKNKETRKSLENLMEVSASNNENGEDDDDNQAVAEDNSASNGGELEEPTSHRVQAVIEHHDEMDDYISRLVGECLDRMAPEIHEEETEDEEKNEEKEVDQECEQDESKPGTSAETNKATKREKLDSGIGDEIIEAHVSSDEGDNVGLDTISSCDEDGVAEKRHKGDSSISETEEEDQKDSANEMRMYQSPYTEYMREKIQELPLPLILKRYLNYYRNLSTKRDE
ncbi:protein-L-isoaspartate O-methyltransferase domain-containing protein 1-like [Anthonomus grandis grandis]|uniref:protein-L-isoaspartate O-methyltransferase domain-containing protein 1-like n=1 Tax=Anthonomus grandis grandis TaxID=2921223 RepID=UPI00216559F1|nr:protein-L-isoaspartate O-methyltransferase domain-containing protein 1-like [Anthonomus grandis grandis]XP_050313556.1 protein-L-isoaspartate O-methyltransferase domain-containing protein 1-like [Anthonomus grandis grandis]